MFGIDDCQTGISGSDCVWKKVGHLLSLEESAIERTPVHLVPTVLQLRLFACVNNNTTLLTLFTNPTQIINIYLFQPEGGSARDQNIFQKRNWKKMYRIKKHLTHNCRLMQTQIGATNKITPYFGQWVVFTSESMEFLPSTAFSRRNKQRSWMS